jgi:hypothetical protein
LRASDDHPSMPSIDTLSADDEVRHRWPLPLATLLLLLLALTPACAAPWRHGASTVDASSTDEEHRERVVRAMLDSEALYTVAGGLKPVSTGFWGASLEVAQPDLTEIARAQRLLGGLSGVDEQLEFGVMSFAQVHEGKRAAEAWVSHRGALAAALERHAEFFAPLGVGPHLQTGEILAIVERLPRLERFRGYGYLFGYPDYAVEFFVAAAADEERTGEAPPREFAHVPTHGAEKHRFVWAVPSGHVENDADRELRRRAAPVLERYRALRERHIGPKRPGAVALLRAASRLRPAAALTTQPALTRSTP